MGKQIRLVGVFSGLLMLRSPMGNTSLLIESSPGRSAQTFKHGSSIKYWGPPPEVLIQLASGMAWALGRIKMAIFTLSYGRSQHHIVKWSSSWNLKDKQAAMLLKCAVQVENHSLERSRLGVRRHTELRGNHIWVEISAQPFLTLWCCSLNPTEPLFLPLKNTENSYWSSLLLV